MDIFSLADENTCFCYQEVVRIISSISRPNIYELTIMLFHITRLTCQILSKVYHMVMCSTVWDRSKMADEWLIQGEPETIPFHPFLIRFISLQGMQCKEEVQKLALYKLLKNIQEEVILY